MTGFIPLINRKILFLNMGIIFIHRLPWAMKESLEMN